MKINKFEEIFKSHLNSNIELTKKTFLNYSKVIFYDQKPCAKFESN